MTKCERGDLDGVRIHVSRIRTRMPSATTTTASVLGSRGAVGTAGRGLDSEVHYCMASEAFRHFLH